MLPYKEQFSISDSKGEPIIKPKNKKVLKAFRDQGGGNTQIITQITMEEWRVR